MKVYYNDRGFQLGNLLFVLMQAHKDKLAGIDQDKIMIQLCWIHSAESIF